MQIPSTQSIQPKSSPHHTTITLLEWNTELQKCYRSVGTQRPGPDTFCGDGLRPSIPKTTSSTGRMPNRNGTIRKCHHPPDWSWYCSKAGCARRPWAAQRHHHPVWYSIVLPMGVPTQPHHSKSLSLLFCVSIIEKDHTK
jgi:hypothetical protein